MHDMSFTAPPGCGCPHLDQNRPSYPRVHPVGSTCQHSCTVDDAREAGFSQSSLAPTYAGSHGSPTSSSSSSRSNSSTQSGRSSFSNASSLLSDSPWPLSSSASSLATSISTSSTSPKSCKSTTFRGDLGDLADKTSQEYLKTSDTVFPYTTTRKRSTPSLHALSLTPLPSTSGALCSLTDANEEEKTSAVAGENRSRSTSISTSSSQRIFSRAISCAHGECVMAGPSERMIELCRIRKYRRDKQGRKLTNKQDSEPRLMVLDNACGPSALVTSQLVDALPVGLLKEAQFVATDLSPRTVAMATRRVEERSWADHVFTANMDMLRMDCLGDGDFTHVFTNFGVSLALDAHAALREMHRILAPGGVCAFTVWKRLQWLDILAEAIKTEYKSAPAPFPSHDDAMLSLSRWYDWHKEDFVRKILKEAEFPELEELETSSSSDSDLPSTLVPSDVTDITTEDWAAYEYDYPASKKEEVPATPVSSASASKAGKQPRSALKRNRRQSNSSDEGTKSSASISAPKSNVLIEESISTHRYTKHEFMENFGTSVMDHILRQSWGRKYLEGPDVKRNLRLAVWKHLANRYPGDMTEIKLDYTAHVVVTRKGMSTTER